MVKQLVLTTETTTLKKVADMKKKAINMLNTPLKIMGDYYSHVLERPISIMQTKVITETQIAFLATILPLDYNLALRSLACAWLIITLKKCKRLL